MYRPGTVVTDAMRKALIGELELAHGDIDVVAKRLGCSERTVRRHLRRFGLNEFAKQLRHSRLEHAA